MDRKGEIKKDIPGSQSHRLLGDCASLPSVIPADTKDDQDLQHKLQQFLSWQSGSNKKKPKQPNILDYDARSILSKNTLVYRSQNGEDGVSSSSRPTL